MEIINDSKKVNIMFCSSIGHVLIFFYRCPSRTSSIPSFCYCSNCDKRYCDTLEFYILHVGEVY